MKLLKKIRRIASQQKRVNSQATNNLSPITFHSVHGENVRISGNGTVAERTNSYCKGICFSHRPIRINERVCIRIKDICQFWSGVLRFGFTTKDPCTLRNSLPKYACPNLTNCGHTYAKALPERYASQNSILTFYLSSNGNVHYSINGVDKGIILSNIKMNAPFWAVIDLYGNTSKIELIDSRHQLNNRSLSQTIYQSERLYSSVSMMDLPNEMSHEPSPQIYCGKHLEPLQFHRIRGCNVRLSQNKCVAERNSNYYSHGYVFSQRPLAIGEKIVMQILRTDQMFTGSLAFGLTSCNPGYLNVTDLPENSHHLLDRPEYWTVIKDVANSPMAGDEIAFTITSKGEVLMTKNRQRPITLMHIDVTQKLWAFFDLYGSTLKIRMLGSQQQHVNAHSPHKNKNKSSSFTLINQSLHHSISMHNMYKSWSQLMESNYNSKSINNNNNNNNSNSNNEHYYHNYHNDQPIHMQQQTITRENRANASKKAAVYPKNIHFPSSDVILQHSKNSSSCSNSSTNSFGNECVVCYEEPINSVFYTCGHVCMCFKCSIKQWQTSGHCPICRARIVDVIRTYWS